VQHNSTKKIFMAPNIALPDCKPDNNKAAETAKQSA